MTTTAARLTLAALLACVPVTVAIAQGQGRTPVRTMALTVPITGTIDGAATAGTFTVQRFVQQNEELFAVGTLVTTVSDTGAAVPPGASKETGTETSTASNTSSGSQPAAGGDANAGAARTMVSLVALPMNLAQTSGSCQQLHLQLGPLGASFAEMKVHVDQVALDVTAGSGAGNPLGNALCGAAGVLGKTGPGNPLADQLNQLLALIG